jgi:hypothetical protein
MVEIRSVLQPISIFYGSRFPAFLDMHLRNKAPEEINQTLIAHQAHLETKEPVAATLIKKIRVALLNNNFFYDYQLILKDGFEEALLAEKLFQSTFGLLEQQDLPDLGKPIGVLMVGKNTEGKVKTVLTPMDLYLFGFSKNGNPLYLRYFKHARI